MVAETHDVSKEFVMGQRMGLEHGIDTYTFHDYSETIHLDIEQCPLSQPALGLTGTAAIEMVWQSAGGDDDRREP